MQHFLRPGLLFAVWLTVALPVAARACAAGLKLAAAPAGAGACGREPDCLDCRDDAPAGPVLLAASGAGTNRSGHPAAHSDGCCPNGCHNPCGRACCGLFCTMDPQPLPQPAFAGPVAMLEPRRGMYLDPAEIFHPPRL